MWLLHGNLLVYQRYKSAVVAVSTQRTLKCFDFLHKDIQISEHSQSHIYNFEGSKIRDQ